MDPTNPNLEKYLQSQVRDYLEARQWRTFRHTPIVATMRGQTFSTGEKGMPDLEAIFYFRGGLSLLLWLEFKQAGKPLRPHQAEWHFKEQNRGAEVWKVDDFDRFEHDYRRCFGWLSSGRFGRGQRDMFAAIPAELHPAALPLTI